MELCLTEFACPAKDLQPAGPGLVVMFNLGIRTNHNSLIELGDLRM